MIHVHKFSPCRPLLPSLPMPFELHLTPLVQYCDFSWVGLLWTWSHRPKGQHITQLPFLREGLSKVLSSRAPKPHASSFFCWGLPRGVAKFPIYGEVFSTYQWKARQGHHCVDLSVSDIWGVPQWQVASGRVRNCISPNCLALQHIFQFHYVTNKHLKLHADGWVEIKREDQSC